MNNINLKKNLYCLLAAISFLILAASSAQVNKIHCGAFNLAPNGEDSTESRNYVELTNGKKMYGRKITYTSGLLSKDQVKIDDNKYKFKETRGFSQNGTYYFLYKGALYERFIHGKLNVYDTQESTTTTSTDHSGFSHTSTKMHCYFYVQVGDKGDLKPIGGQKDIKEFVKDCPKAYEMADKSNKQIRRSIREDRAYLNNIFVTYNNGCK